MLVSNESINGYRELRAHLQARIESGAPGPGQQLPSEAELSRWHGLNRHTVRAALRDLELAGYVFKVRGKGTFVARRKIPYALAPGTSFTAALEKLGLEGNAQVNDAYEMPATAEIAEYLGVAPGVRLTVLEITRAIEEVPVAFTVSYLPSERFPGLIERAASIRSLYRVLKENYGVKEIHRVWSQIEAIMPGAREQEALAIPHGLPLLLTRNLARDGQGAAVEFCVSHYRGDAYTLQVNFENREQA